MSIPIDRCSSTPLRPRDVVADKLHQAFGSRDTEAVAIHIVLLCQRKGNWKPFRFEELLEFCGSSEKTKQFLDAGLLNLTLGDFIRRDGNKITLYTSFVARCYLKSPATTIPKKRIRTPKRRSTESVYQRLLTEDLLGERPKP